MKKQVNAARNTINNPSIKSHNSQTESTSYRGASRRSKRGPKFDAM
jgi:hypothetical protein